MKTHTKLLLAAATVASLAACGGGDDSLDDRADLADPKVRLVHAVPLAPNISLLRNGAAQSAEVTDLPYKGASGYFDVDTTTDRWDVVTATAPSVTVGSVSLDARRGNKYTFIAVPNANSVTELEVINDPFNKGLTSDNARVRVFNAAFNAGPVDVYLTAPNAGITTATPLFAGVDYKMASPASGQDSVEVEGSTYRLRVTHAGTKQVIFNTTVDIANNADWLLTPIPGSVNPNDIKVLAVRADSGTPAVELTTQ